MQSAAAAPGTMGFELQRTFRASPERVFGAWTQPAALRAWWCPPGWVAGEIEIDLRIGGSYSVAMSRAGSAGSVVSVSGRFLEVRPPERLVYTWRWEGAFEWVRPRGAAIGFPRRLAATPIDDFASELVSEEGVLLLPGSIYEQAGNHFRLGFGRRNMPEALARLERFAGARL